MQRRRIYWHRGEALNVAQRVYAVPEFKLFVQLSKSFERLNIEPKVGFQVVWTFYYEYWQLLLRHFDGKVYFKLVQVVRGRLSEGCGDGPAVAHGRGLTRLKTNILFYMSGVTMQSKPFRQSIFRGYYLNSSFDIHFIRTQRRYNKRRYARVRAVSRPSFWVGNLLSCLLIGMFWGASLQGVDGLIIQPVIVDVNVILLYGYISICYKYILVSVNNRTRALRADRKIMASRLYGLYQYYLNDLK